MKKLIHLLFVLTVLSSYSQQNVIPDYDLAAKFSPKKNSKTGSFNFCKSTLVKSRRQILVSI